VAVGNLVGVVTLALLHDYLFQSLIEGEWSAQLDIGAILMPHRVVIRMSSSRITLIKRESIRELSWIHSKG
jgi:hypothetical protein